MSGNETIIFAHRGMCREAPENTLPAIEQTIAQGIGGIEIDVRLSKDKVPIVVHSDELYEYTTTYSFVHSTSLRALKTIDVGTHFDATFHSERMPTLAEAMDVMRGSNLLINLEFKTQPLWHVGLEDRAVKVILDMGMADQVIISTFSIGMLLRLRHLAPTIPRGILFGTRPLLFLKSRMFGKLCDVASIHPSAHTVNAELVEMVHTHGWKLYPWTVNEPGEMQRLLALGVDGLITDEPLVARDVLGETAHGV